MAAQRLQDLAVETVWSIMAWPRPAATASGRPWATPSGARPAETASGSGTPSAGCSGTPSGTRATEIPSARPAPSVLTHTPALEHREGLVGSEMGLRDSGQAVKDVLTGEARHRMRDADADPDDWTIVGDYDYVRDLSLIHI